MFTVREIVHIQEVTYQRTLGKKMEADTKILQKIRNLLKKADPARNNNLNEMIACGEIAQRLMNTYRISYEVAMGDIDGIPKSAQEKVVDYVKENNNAFTSLRNPSKWLQGLLCLVSEYNHCEVYLTNFVTEEEGKDVKFQSFSIVGRMTDIYIVEEIFYWLMLQTIQISFSQGKGKDDQWINDFRTGAVAKLREKFEALKQKPEVPEGVTEEQFKAALVRIDDKKKEVDAMMEEINKNLEAQAEEKKIDTNAFTAGYEAADRIGIDMPKNELDNSSAHVKSLTTGE